MSNTRRRETFEVVGILSVVAGLLLVALEIRQANSIARAQAVMDLSSAYNEINSARFGDSEVARLISIIENAEDQEVSDLDASKITGLAYQVHNIMWAAQTAYDNGLSSEQDLENYRIDMMSFFENWPGIIPDVIAIYESQPGKKDAYIFEPLAKWAAAD
jgi:hypothetical protein